MIDWTKSMQQSYEFFEVDPGTWGDKKQLNCITNGTINRDIEQVSLGSASFECTDNPGETYIRTYLVANQNENIERIPLGTHIAQSPNKNFDGIISKSSIDAYTSLLELKENYPPIGYTLAKDKTNAMYMAYLLCREHMRAPVQQLEDAYTLKYDYTADPSDKWLDYVSELISIAGYRFTVDGYGKIGFTKQESIEKSDSVWTYTDDNSSILYPEVTLQQDLYGIPNVVEAIYSSGNQTLYSRVVNDAADSPISTVNRGREITHRTTDPSIMGLPNQAKLDEFAMKTLKDMSVLQCTLTYKHGYCPVNIGDCVTLNYKSANIENVKARVISQSISCVPGCPVTETAIFTKKLWG